MNITLTGDLTITITCPFDGKLATLAEPTRITPPPCAPVVPMPGEPARAVMGRYVAVLRTHERWTQAELGEMLGIKPMTVSRLESGQRPISIDELALIAKTFGLTCAELISVIDTEEERANEHRG